MESPIVSFSILEPLYRLFFHSRRKQKNEKMKSTSQPNKRNEKKKEKTFFFIIIPHSKDSWSRIPILQIQKESSTRK